jgi:hypothetical protein
VLILVGSLRRRWIGIGVGLTGLRIRKFIEEKVRGLEAEENFKRILNELKKASWSVPKGFSVESMRKDRDSS